MSKKITVEEVEERLKNLEDIDHHKIDLSNYKNLSVDKVCITDLRCGHEYNMTLKNFIKGQRCPKCSYDKRACKLKTKTEDIELPEKLEILKFNGINLINTYRCKRCNTIHNITHKMSLSKKFKCMCDVPKVKKYNKNIDKYNDILKELEIKIVPEYFTSTIKPAVFKCKVCNNHSIGYYNNIVVNNSRPCKCRDIVSNENPYEENLNAKNISMLDKFRRVNDVYTFKHAECGKVFKKKLGDILYNDQGCPSCSFSKRQVVDVDDISTKLRDKYNLEIVGEYINTSIQTKLKCIKCNTVFEDKVRKIFMKKDKYGCPTCTSFTNKSIGETAISEYLNHLGIEFTPQKTFKGLEYISSLKYDFYIDEYNLAIEFNGIQHYQPVEYFGGEKYYKTLVECDNKKKKYAHENNINLLVIKYSDINNIREIIDRKLYEMKVSRTVWDRGKE